MTAEELADEEWGPVKKDKKAKKGKKKGKAAQDDEDEEEKPSKSRSWNCLSARMEVLIRRRLKLRHRSLHLPKPLHRLHHPRIRMKMRNMQTMELRKSCPRRRRRS